ncbi:type II secretion system protein [Halobacillus sp. Nhm2S1]|uniref:type II secretion system protein n=1 Tax=Halobacillus sp. Nhm2S1 TaxID=2866716 RepID=UPI001C72BDFE|nr:type II secretion system protein [Halobacillus sp. Nhm2S1]MBX0358704.1 type II secretion system GspH family protein [Halobacillus sp. Nhm2S1]
MRKSEGFTMLETLSAFILLMVITLFTLPLLTELRVAQKDLQIERQATKLIQNEFFEHRTRNGPLPYTSKHQLKHEITLVITQEEEWIRGCASWKNQRKENKEFCLHDKRE